MKGSNEYVYYSYDASYNAIASRNNPKETLIITNTAVSVY